MASNNYLILLLLIITAKSWTPESMWKDNALTAGICSIDTQCRVPNMSEYKYDGQIRSGYLKVELKGGSALGFMFFGKTGASVQ